MSETFKKVFVASTDTPILRHGWGMDFVEKLVHTNEAVDLSRFENEMGRMHLYHDSTTPCGIITRAWVEEDKGRLMVEAEFDPAIEEGERAIERIKSGLYDRVSVGWDYDARNVMDRKISFEEHGADWEITYRKWTPTELSFVSIPADIDAGAARSLSNQTNHNKRMRAISTLIEQRRTAMSDNPTPTNNAYLVFRSKRDALIGVGFTADQIDAAMDASVAANEDTAAANQRVLDMLSNPPAKAEPDAPKADTRELYDVFKNARGALRNVGVSQESIDEAFDASVAAGETPLQANARVMSLLESGNPALANPQRGPAVHTDSGKNQYSLARAIMLKTAGRLYEFEGRGSLESELHFEAIKTREEKTNRTLIANEVPLPFDLLMRDKHVRSEIARTTKNQNLARALNTTDNAGILTDSFNEMDLVEELYSRNGILPHVDKFPGLLNQNLKIPVEDDRTGGGWTGETTTRSDTSTPDYADTLEWSWKEVYSQFPITRQLIDQTAYIYDRVLMLLREDIPRHINSAILNGTGSNNQPTGLLTASGIGVTEVGTNGTVLDWDTLNKMVTAVQAANAHYVGEGMFFAPAQVLGKLRATETASGTNGEFIIPRTAPADMPTIMGMRAVMDNNIPTGRTKGTANSTVSSILYGIPRTVKIGYFSGLDMIIDPYSSKKSGQIDIQIRQALDFQIRYTAAWQKIADVNYA